MKRIVSVVIMFGLLLSSNKFYAQESGEVMVSIGASLSQEQKQKILNLFAVSEVKNVIEVDGELVNKYLNDGTDNSVGIYSSSKVEFKNPGYGIQVYVITPENITSVSESAYKNAAIAAGAQNANISIASVEPVTGEGALAGVYEIFSQSGLELDATNIQNAENQIKIEKLLTEETNLSETEISKLITDINLNIVYALEQKGSLSEEDVLTIIDETLSEYQYDLNETAKNALMENSINFSKSDIAKDPNTKAALEEAMASYSENNFSHVLGKEYANGDLSVLLNEVGFTEERDEYSTEQYENVLKINYTLTNNSDTQHGTGSELSLYVDGKKVENYYLPSTVMDLVSAGRSIDISVAFGFSGDYENMELELKDPASFVEPPTIIPLTQNELNNETSLQKEPSEEVSDSEEATEFIMTLENEDLKAVLLGFLESGLNVMEPEVMGREDFGIAPLVTDQAVHFGAQYAEFPVTDVDGNKDPYNYGRLFYVESEEDLKILKEAYDSLSKQSAMLYSHTYSKGKILLQMGGDVPDEDFAKYTNIIDTIIQ